MREAGKTAVISICGGSGSGKCKYDPGDAGFETLLPRIMEFLAETIPDLRVPSK